MVPEIVLKFTIINIIILTISQEVLGNGMYQCITSPQKDHNKQELDPYRSQPSYHLTALSKVQSLLRGFAPEDPKTNLPLHLKNTLKALQKAGSSSVLSLVGFFKGSVLIEKF